MQEAHRILSLRLLKGKPAGTDVDQLVEQKFHVGGGRMQALVEKRGRDYFERILLVISRESELPYNRVLTL
jgi:hypothetical protein